MTGFRDWALPALHALVEQGIQGPEAERALLSARERWEASGLDPWATNGDPVAFAARIAAGHPGGPPVAVAIDLTEESVDQEPGVEGPVAPPRAPELRAEFDRFDWLPGVWVELPEPTREWYDEWVLAARTRGGARTRAKAVRQRFYYAGSSSGALGGDVTVTWVGW